MAGLRFRDDNFSYDEVYAAVSEVSGPGIDFYVLMALSVVIASFGLLLNSGAVIIGAMIVSPLMDPLLALSFSSLSQHWTLKIRSIFTIVTGIILGLLISYLIGSMFSFIGHTPEILARTQPTTMDLFVALAAGFIGGYAKVRKTVGGSIYGVAISISLIPPLSVVGIGLAYGEPTIFLGSALLFLTNVASVILSGILAFMLLEFEYFRKSTQSIIAPLVAVLVLAIPLTWGFSNLVDKRVLRNELSRALTSDTYTFRNLDVVQIDVNPYSQPILVDVTVRASVESITQHQIDQVQTFLTRKIRKPVQLVVHVAPTVTLTGTGTNASR